MVRYQGSLSSPSITGAIVSNPVATRPWQPSTWPKTPSKWDQSLVAVMQTIFEQSILNEINNVIADAGGNLEHRGHVVGIALLCALDAISSYGYGAKSGKQIPAFVRAHFPTEYHPHAKAVLRLYRHAMIHSWNLFEAAILPGNDPVTLENGILCFGLLHLRDAISKGAGDYLKKLETDQTLQGMTLKRYRQLRASAKN
jgi:hypothetical protein